MEGHMMMEEQDLYVLRKVVEHFSVGKWKLENETGVNMDAWCFQGCSHTGNKPWFPEF